MTFKQLNILLADDDTDDCIFFKEAVNELSESLQLTTVNDGEQLMQLLTNGLNKLPDVLFLDLNMPRKNGFECLSEIKFSKKLNQLPVIIFSTSFEQDVVNRLYKNGAQYFIRKPSEFSQFKKIIQQSLALITPENISQPTRENFVLTLQNSVITKRINLSRQKMIKKLESDKDELIIAHKELAFQKEEKGKLAAELIIAHKELAFLKQEKGKRATELGIANKELVFQVEEKEKRAAELIIANKELVFQNEEKEKRAAELIIANKELAFQNEEKEKRAAELSIANKELLAFTYISSHDLQEPLRKIQTFVTIILENENNNLSENGKYNFQRMQLAAGRMQQLIDDLLAFSRIATTELKFEKTALNVIIEEVKAELKDTIQEKHATIEASELGSSNIISFQFRQLIYNLISNALKFSQPDIPSHIIIKSRIVKGSKINSKKLSPEKNYCHITIKDNGIGFEPHFSERIFEVFQKLHGKEVYGGTGIGLAIVKKIVENHNGIITATSKLNEGATFDIYIPAE